MSVNRKRLTFEHLETRNLLTSLSMVDYFDTWSGGIVRSTDVAGITYHPGSGRLYLADSEINELSLFVGHNIFETSLQGDQVIREIESHNGEPVGITYNSFDNYFYIVNDKLSAIQRYDHNLNSPLATVFTTDSVPNSFDPEGVTSDPLNGNMFIVDGSLGGRQVLVYNSDLHFQYSFSVSSKIRDGEGIALDPISRHLFIVSGKDDAIFEYTLDGTFIDEFDLGDFPIKPAAPQGLTFAPTSDPNDDPTAMSLYIVDGMEDNYPDGRVFEAIVTGQQPSQNQPPNVNAGPDQNLYVENFATNVATLNGTVSDDFLPSPPSATTSVWTQVSGPSPVTFTDATSVDTVATFTEEGVFVLRLTANDGALVASDDVTIVVQQANGTSTIAVPIQTNSDDAEESSSGSMNLTSSDLDLGSKYTGLRFTGINIPQGAAILEAYVQFVADESTSESGLFTIVGEATDNSATFNTVISNLTARPKTSASVQWSPPTWLGTSSGVNERTPNISSIIQELVSRPGWNSGGAMSIFVSGDGHRAAESHESKEGPALLYVRYAGAVPTTNHPPLTGAGADQTVVLPNTATLDGTVTDDGSPGPVTTTWTQVDGPGTVNFANASAVDTIAAFSVDGTYTLRLTADDGALTSSDDVVITVLNAGGPNQPPQVEAGIDSNVILPNTAALDGTVTDDGQLGPVTTSWTKLGGPGSVTFGDASVVDTTAAFSAAGTYILRLTANDGQYLVTDDLIITVYDVSNQAPQVDAGTDQGVSRPNTATLDGTVSDDGLLAPVTTTWSQFAGPGTVTFGNVNELDTTAAFSADGTYVLRLTADDGDLQATDDVTLTVVSLPNQAPVVEAGADQNVTLPNAAALDGTVTDDSLPGPVTTTWSKFNGPGTVTFGNINAVDTTAAFSVVGTYVLRLTADDGEFVTSDEITITVDSPPNQAPQVAAGFDQTVTLPNPVTLDGTVSDDGLPGPVTTTWTMLSGPGTVTFGDASSVDTTAALSTHGTYVLRLTADDSDLVTTDDVTITVQLPPNQAPVVSAGFDRNVVLPNALVLDGTVTDDGQVGPISTTWTKVSGSGIVTFADASALDTTATLSLDGTYVLRLTADDGEFVTTDDVIITVVDPAAQVTLLDVSVSASSDGAEESKSGAVDLPSTDLDLGKKSTGLRFDGVAVLPGATVVDAYIQFHADETGILPTVLTIKGEATDNSTTFTTAHFNVTSRPTTTAGAAWSVPNWVAGEKGLNQRTPDLSAIIQEIVSRAGWNSGAAITLTLTGAGHRAAESLEGGSAPTLHVEFRGGTPPPNEAPQVHAGADQNLVLPNTLALDGTVSDDGRLAPLITTWSIASGPGSATFANANAVDTTATFSVAGTYVLRLTADDGEFVTTDDTTITVVLPPNQAPQTNAGIHQTIPFPSIATLDGTVTDDGQPAPVTTTWSKVSGAGTVTFQDATAVDTTAGFSLEGTYVLRLTAADGEFVTTDDVVVTVVDPSTQVTVLDLSVTAGSDDVEEYKSGAMDLPSTDLDIGRRTIGVRFTGVEINPGATITDAYLQFQADETGTAPTLLTIVGEATDSSTAFAASPFNVTSRPTTTASAQWSIPAWTVGEIGLNQRSPDISSIVQEIVSRSGWSMGNALSIILGGSGNRAAETWEGNAAAQLHIEFKGGTPPTNQAPVVDAGANQSVVFPNTVALDGTATDDGQPAPVTTTWSRVIGPGTVTFGDASAVETTAAFSAEGTYMLRLTADDGELVTTDEIVITVTLPPNQAPQVNAGVDQSVVFPGSVTLDGTVTDDGQVAPVTTTWSMVSGPGTVTFGDASGIDTTADFSAVGTYVLRLAANDGEFVDADDVTVTVVATNQAPQVNAGSDQNVSLPNTAALDGTVTDDGQLGPVTVAWSTVSGPGAATFNDSSAVDTTAAFSVEGTYVLRLTANDGEFTSADDVTITAVFPNQAPQVTAGTGQSVVIPNTATLDGTVTDDGKPGPVTTTWSKVSGPGTVTFGDANAVDTTAGFSLDGTYVLRLTADDGEFTTTDDVTITAVDLSAQITVLDVSVVARNDDAEQSLSGTMDLASSDLDLGTRVVGLRFDGLDINRDATIVDAYIQFEADENGADVALLTLTGEAAANSVTFSATPLNISSRPTTSASVAWSVPAWTVGERSLNERTPDISSIIQQIVATPGWTNGNALSIVVTGGGKRAAEPVEGKGTAPVLHVEFKGGTPPANQAPQVDAGDDRNTVLPNTTTLNGTVTDDGQPGPVTTTWTQLSGPGTVSFGNANSVDTTASFSAEGTYVVRLTANDGEFTSTDDVTITVFGGGASNSIDVSVSSGSDDAEESKSGVSELPSRDLDFGKRAVGLRFAGVNVPQGATILNAYIQLQADETGSAATLLTLAGEATDNSTTFTTDAFNVTSRPATTATVSWSPPAWTVGEVGPNEQTPDISSIIQEIVSRPGWNTGGAMSIIFTGTGRRAAEPFEGNGAVPRLHIDFTTTGSPLRVDSAVVDKQEPQTTLTPDALASVVAEAIARWTVAGLEESQVEALQKADVRIADLDPLGYLGLTTTDGVFIDDDGAGYGWRIDAGMGCESAASVEVWDCLSSTQIDLLTVTMHELGHVLGLVDRDPTLYPRDLMAATLSPGVHRADSIVPTDTLLDSGLDLHNFTLLDVIPSATVARSQSHPEVASNTDTEAIVAPDKWLHARISTSIHRDLMTPISTPPSAQLSEEVVDQLFSQLDTLNTLLDDRLKTSR